MIATNKNIMKEREIAKRIFLHLSKEDFLNCALVSRNWRKAVDDFRGLRELMIRPELLKSTNLKDLIRKHKYAVEINIYGFSRQVHIPASFYDRLLRSKMLARKLILRGRGLWDTCVCPKKEASKCSTAEQHGKFTSNDITNLETIIVQSTFRISACVFLDLCTRSPRLKSIYFYGLIVKCDHNVLFENRRFLCDIERVYWPWVVTAHVPTIQTLCFRNENITVFHSDGNYSFTLISREVLPNLRYLSLNLNEAWTCEPGKYKKLRGYIENMKYLRLATKIEGLELRTYDTFEETDSIDDSNTKQEVERLYEQYKLDFWTQVAQLPNLKYLGIFGSWEFDKVCRDMQKNNLKLEYLKISLNPASMVQCLESETPDDLELSMHDGLKHLRKLEQLKSVHLSNFEKLASINAKTVTALKELMDVIWILDIRTFYTPTVEDLLNNMMRRANQLGKVYMVRLHVEPNDSTRANLLTEEKLKFPINTNLKEKLNSLAEAKSKQVYGDSLYQNFHIWALELIDSKDKKAFNELKSKWQHYNEMFHSDLRNI